MVTEDSLVHRSAEFEAAIRSGEKDSLRALCEKQIQDSLYVSFLKQHAYWSCLFYLICSCVFVSVDRSEDEKEVWAFLKVMFEEDGTARTKLLTHLGFRVPNVESEVTSDELGKELTNTLNFDENVKSSAVFEGDITSFPIDNGDDFFNNPQPSDDKELIEEEEIHEEQAPRETEATSDDSDPSIDEAIQRALVVGDYKEAVRLCLSANRLADALVIAHVGGHSLWESTRDKYLQNSLSPYLKVCIFNY